MSDWWQDFPWRLIQTNLREIDMRDIRAEQVVTDLKSFRATVLMINAAGIIASYPTKLPFHFQSPYLAGDSLADIIATCHDAGIRVIARTDFSKVRRPIFEQHPDWACRTAEGGVIDYNGDIHVCVSGPYQQQFSLQILEEMFTLLPFDGIFFNMGGFQTHDYSGNYHGPCQCDNCRAAFDAMCGLPLPTREDMADPTFRKYCVFKRRTVTAQQERVYRFITERWPHVCIANHHAAGRGFIRQESNTAIDRPLPHWQYSGSDNTRWATVNYPDMVSSNTTVDFIDFPYRHVTVSPHQQKLRLAQGLVNGGAIDWYLIGRLDNHEDRSGFQPVREMFAFHAQHEQTYRGLQSRANVALVGGWHVNGAEYRGWFRVLAEHHFLFDSLRSDVAADRDWSRYDAIILPEVEGISDALAATLDAFVREGGRLIATGRSGWRDEAYEPREMPALDCLGIEAIEEVCEQTRSTYIKLGAGHGLPRLADTELVYVDGIRIRARYAADVDQRFRIVPPHNFGPPERCYYEMVVDEPGLTTRQVDRGRAIYIPWLPGALFHRQGHLNTSWFMADVLEHIAGVAPVRGNVSPQVETTLHENADGRLLLQLVNTSGHFGNSFYEPIPMRDIELAVKLPRPAARARGLVADADYDCAWSDGELTVHVPELAMLEAIVID